MAILELHKLTLGGSVDGGATKVYYCLLRPETYTSIGSIVGITKVTDEAELNNAKTSVAELIGAGVAFRLQVDGKIGGRRRSFNLLCARDRIGTAMDGLKGKTVNSVVVGAARVKRRASFY